MIEIIIENISQVNTVNSKLNLSPLINNAILRSEETTPPTKNSIPFSYDHFTSFDRFYL